MQIKPLFTLLIAASLSGCGSFSADKGEDSSSDAETADQVPISRSGVPGRAGADGAAGEAGAQGAAGPSAAVVAIGLFDSNDLLLGYKFNDGETADVFLVDGTRALIDMDSGDLQTLSPFNFFCLYEAADCSGACLVYDRRWLNLLVLDANQGVYLAPRGTANLGAKTMNSYVDENAVCVANTIATTDSYQAQSYSGSAAVPFAAPLYWGLEE